MLPKKRTPIVTEDSLVTHLEIVALTVAGDRMYFFAPDSRETLAEMSVSVAVSISLVT